MVLSSSFSLSLSRHFVDKCYFRLGDTRDVGASVLVGQMFSCYKFHCRPGETRSRASYSAGHGRTGIDVCICSFEIVEAASIVVVRLEGCCQVSDHFNFYSRLGDVEGVAGDESVSIVSKGTT